MGEVYKGVKPGRPKRAEYDSIVKALSARFPPDYVMDQLEKAMDIAEKQNSSRGIINVLRFIAEYTEGLPVKRVVHSKNGYDKLAQLMASIRSGMVEQSDDPSVIVLDNPPKKLEAMEDRQE